MQNKTPLLLNILKLSLKVFKDLKEFKAQEEIQAPREIMAHKVKKDLRASMVLQGKGVHKVSTVLQVKRSSG